MRIKLVVFFIYVVSTTFFTFSNDSTTVTIKGKISNQLNEPIVYANVALYQSIDSVFINVVLSDTLGNYQIKKQLKTGAYILHISYLGLENKYLHLNIDTNSTLFIENITLENNIELDQVEVTAHKTYIKQYADRIEVNVSEDILNTGGSALGALQRSPGVSVDLQGGNVKLMGKDVLILIDGRESKMPTSDVLAMLETMPVENVVTLDLMTTPPAQYEAEGKGGVINIRLKKAENEGFNGSISSSLGYSRFWKYREGCTIYYSKKKIALFGGLNYVNEKNYQKSNEQFSWEDHETVSTIERTRNQPAFTYRTGLDYQINIKNNIGVGIDGFLKPKNTYLGIAESNVYNQTLLDSTINNEYSSPSRSNNVHSNLYFKHTFPKKNVLQLNFDYLYDWFEENGNYYGKTNDSTDNLKSIWSLTNPSQAQTDVLALRADYSQITKKNQSLDIGLKGSIVNIDYIGSYQFTQNTTHLQRKSTFDYSEQNYAIYTAWSDKLGAKVKYKIGLRSELSKTVANSETTTNIIDTTYIKIFPSIFIMYSITDDKALKLSYNKRINRPTYRSLNPFEYYISQISVIAGSPELFPSITHNFELGYVYKEWLNNFYYMYSQNEISQIIKQTGHSSSMYLYDNIGDNHEWGFFTGGYKQLLKWWGVYADITLNYSYTDYLIFGKKEQTKGFETSISISSQFFLPKEIKLELSCYAQTPEVVGFYERQSFYSIDFKAAKSFGQKKNVSFSLKIKDLLNTDKRRSIGYSDGISIDVKNRYDSRQIALSVLCKFGKAKNKSIKEQNIIEEEQKRLKL
ncbi:MAG: TonB-dependent receptor [Bacteroidales bacterium]|nr:TonB-dependent receptor [Bacteroidales bacterium]